MNYFRYFYTFLTVMFISIVLRQHKDPVEKLTGKIWTFNEYLDDNIAKPTAEIYTSITPDFIEIGITNFFRNINELDNTANQLLQGKPVYAMNDFARFIINTSVGILGFIDIASKLGLERHDEDFGQTLGPGE